MVMQTILEYIVYPWSYLHERCRLQIRLRKYTTIIQRRGKGHFVSDELSREQVSTPDLCLHTSPIGLDTRFYHIRRYEPCLFRQS
jgi:hypothetical protein